MRSVETNQIIDKLSSRSKRHLIILYSTGDGRRPVAGGGLGGRRLPALPDEARAPRHLLRRSASHRRPDQAGVREGATGTTVVQVPPKVSLKFLIVAQLYCCLRHAFPRRGCRHQYCNVRKPLAAIACLHSANGVLLSRRDEREIRPTCQNKRH